MDLLSGMCSSIREMPTNDVYGDCSGMRHHLEATQHNEPDDIRKTKSILDTFAI